MAFEEYQFLRYFIPGSLFVIYTIVLVLPILNSTVVLYFESNPDALLGIIGGGFAASLAFGYIIYTIYDTFGPYDRDVMKSKKRPLFKYLSERIEDWDKFDKPKKKMFTEMLHITGADTKDCDRFYTIIRGFWSHFNARIVCCLWVPIFSAITIFFLIILDFVVGSKFFSFTFPNIFLYIPFTIGIVIISLILVIGAERPRSEATTLEYFFIKYRIDTHAISFEEMVRILEAKLKT